MRDVNRLKEKIELSLDNRQVVSLIIGSLVVMGVVFVLGALVGKKLAAQAGGEPASGDILAAIDSKSEPDASFPDTQLTFHEALTRPAAKVAAAEQALEQKPEPAKPREAPRAKVEEPVAQAEEPKPIEPAVAAPKVAAHKAGTAAEAKTGHPQAVFAVQVAASLDPGEADRLVEKLKALGYRPSVVAADIPGKGRYYRVRLGHFGTKEDAERYLKDFKRETRMNGFVTPSP